MFFPLFYFIAIFLFLDLVSLAETVRMVSLLCSKRAEMAGESCR